MLFSKHFAVFVHISKRVQIFDKTKYFENIFYLRRSSDRSSESDLNYCILGVDTMAREDSASSAPTIGLVLKVLWGMETSLDGDGGFGLHILDRHFMFKPTSLQFLWTVIQVSLILILKDV